MNSRRADTKEAFQASLLEIELLFDGAPDLAEVAPLDRLSPSTEAAKPIGFPGDQGDDELLEPCYLEP